MSGEPSARSIVRETARLSLIQRAELNSHRMAKRTLRQLDLEIRMRRAERIAA